MTPSQITINIVNPSQATLKKYGLTLEDWWEILQRQRLVCPICHKTPSSGRFVTDHEHVRGYKKMSPENKRKYIRGLCCQHCNRWYLAKGMTIEKAQNLVEYLRRFESRK